MSGIYVVFVLLIVAGLMAFGVWYRSGRTVSHVLEDSLDKLDSLARAVDSTDFRLVLSPGDVIDIKGVGRGLHVVSVGAKSAVIARQDGKIVGRIL